METAIGKKLFLLLEEGVKYSLGEIRGGVFEVEVVFFCKVPVGCISLNKAGYDDKPQNHQIDAREDFVHQRRLAHAKGQKP